MSEQTNASHLELDDPEFLAAHGKISPEERKFLNNVKLGRKHDAEGATLSARFVQKLLLFADQIPRAVVGIRLENCVIDGSVNISGAKINNLISITESEIQGDFCCDYTELKALFLDGTKVRRLRGTRCKASASIYLRSRIRKSKDFDVVRFHATEGVNLSGAYIEGALSARGAYIEAAIPSAKATEKKPKYALNIADSRISSIILGPKEKEEDERVCPNDKHTVNACIIKGGITFQRARCQTFSDSELIYETIMAPNSKDILVLRGFKYEALGRYAPRDVAFRKKWLAADTRDDERFEPQTFEQLSQVLAAQGDGAAAREFLIYKETKLHERTKPSLPASYRSIAHRLTSWARWPWHWLVYGFQNTVMRSIGYGYRLHLLIPIMIAVIFAGTVYYDYAFRTGQIVPANALVARSDAWFACYRIGEQRLAKDEIPFSNPALTTSCKKRPLSENPTEAERALYFYPDFNAFWYSVDAFLPILTLRQEEFWVAPDQHRSVLSARTFTHIFSLLGWLLSSLGIVGGLGYLNRS